MASDAGKVRLDLVNQGHANLRKSLAGKLPAKGEIVTIGVRPEHFGNAGVGDCDLTVAVDVAEHLGSTSFAYANTTKGEALVIERDTKHKDTRIESLTVSISSNRVLLFDAEGGRLR